MFHVFRFSVLWLKALEVPAANPFPTLVAPPALLFAFPLATAAKALAPKRLPKRSLLKTTSNKVGVRKGDLARVSVKKETENSGPAETVVQRRRGGAAERSGYEHTN